jgi:hypothetical protein
MYQWYMSIGSDVSAISGFGKQALGRKVAKIQVSTNH